MRPASWRPESHRGVRAIPAGEDRTPGGPRWDGIARSIRDLRTRNFRELLHRWRWLGMPKGPEDNILPLERLVDSPAATFADRQYFIDAEAGVLVWCAEGTENSSRGFSVEVVRSRISGRTTVNVALPTTDTGLSGATRAPRASVVTLSAPIMSAIDAVVPPGFAYAVVDRTGETLFHPGPRRAKVENILAETGSPALAAALRFRPNSPPLYSRYFGFPTRLHLRPILGLDDWTVVVLEDLTYFRTIYGLLVSEWAINFGAYSVILWGLLAILRLRKPDPRSWSWPRADRGVQYLRCILLILVALAAAFPIPFLYDWLTWDAAVVLLPALTLAILIINLRWDQGRARMVRWALALLAGAIGPGLWLVGWLGEDFARPHGLQWLLPGLLFLILVGSPLLRWWVRRDSGRYVSAYTALMSLSLVVFAVVPAAAIFRLAAAHASETHVRYSQIETLRGILDGTERARRGFGGGTGGKPSRRYFLRSFETTTVATGISIRL